LVQGRHDLNDKACFLYSRLTDMAVARNLSGGWKIALPVIFATAACVVLPFLHYGIPSGHDFEFHLNSWIDVVDHWKQGVAYPHWQAMAHYGYGEARFIFYPPSSWTLGALLGLILPWKLVPAAYICVVLTFSGCSMFALARRWLPVTDAVWAAAFYAANPYHLVIVYWRSAFAELLAAACLPLLLLLVLDLEERGARVVPVLSLLLAAGWLTNLPSAVMMNYSLVVLVTCLAIMGRSVVLPVYGAAACILGAGLAGFFLLPAFHQQSWVNISQVLSPGVRPLENFLFAFTDDPDHNHFNLLVSIVALSEIVILVALLFLTRRLGSRRLWWCMRAWSAVAIVLMLKPTLPLWMHLPELRFAQLPWRWLLCLNVPVAMVISLALRRWWLRGLICAVALGVVLLTWHRLLVPWWDTSDDIQEMLDNQHDGAGNEGTDEYVPAGVDPYEADRNAPLVKFEGEGAAQIKVEQWRAESRTIRADSTGEGNVALRLFNYPSWQATVNGREVQTRTAMPAGQMLVPIEAGKNRIQIVFVKGRDQVLGWIVSAGALTAVLIWFLLSRKFAVAPA
jgi:6-pyruvoyl-tetrahydropterin synthase related domain